jgi:predicted DCC family thiol-disulfide oxidoreductase YuxK
MTDTTGNVTDAPIALYHGACPICGTEISHYQRYCGAESLAIGWEDISTGAAAPTLDRLGIDREDAKRRMTVVGADGAVHRGVDAFLVLWREMPRYRPLARVVALPGVYHLGRLVYDHVLAPGLYAWNKRRGR